MKIKTLFRLQSDCHGQESVIVPARLALLSAAFWQDSGDLSACALIFVQYALSEASFHGCGCGCVQNQKYHQKFSLIVLAACFCGHAKERCIPSFLVDTSSHVRSALDGMLQAPKGSTHTSWAWPGNFSLLPTY